MIETLIMKFNLIPTPNRRLSPLVQDYFTISAGETLKNDRLILPSGRQYLIFHIKGEAQYTCNDKHIIVRERALLFHVQTSAYSIKVSPNFEALGVSLAPNGIYQFFGKTFGGKDQSLSDPEQFLGKKELNLLCEELEKAQDTAAKLELVEDLLISLFSGKQEDIVEKFMDYMGDFRKEVTTRKIASELGTNTRSLELKFCAITGTTPGKYIKLQRFNRLINDVASRKYSTYDLVARHNYSDYSHMNRDIRKFSGISLKEISAADNLESTPMGAMV